MEEIKQQNQDKDIHRDFLFGETLGASHQYDHHSPVTHQHGFSWPTRTTLPTVLPSRASEQGGQDEMPMGDYFWEWQSMGDDFRAVLSF